MRDNEEAAIYSSGDTITDRTVHELNSPPMFDKQLPDH